LDIELGMRVYDSLNGRYITIDGVGCDPNVYRCIVEEFNEDASDLEIIGTQLFTRYEIERMMRRS